MLTKGFRQNDSNALFAAVFLLYLLLGNVSAHAAPQAISNDKELSVALKNAKTADDHRRIAAYYQEKARKLQAKEKEEKELADYFATHPSMYGKQYPTPYENHKWRAENYHREASEALQKASQQEEAAESLLAPSH